MSIAEQKATKTAEKRKASENLLRLEDRKLHFLNRSSNAKSPEEQKAIDKEFADVIAFIKSETAVVTRRSAPKPEAAISESAADAAVSHGALATALAGIEAATDEELAEIIGAAGREYAKRLPETKLVDFAGMIGMKVDVAQGKAQVAAPVAKVEAETQDENYIAEESGAYQQPTGEIVKFVQGDKLFLSLEGVMRVEPYIDESVLTKPAIEQMKIGKSLGAGPEVKNKALNLEFLTAKLAERAVSLAAVEDPAAE